jgi:hypothetical protein
MKKAGKASTCYSDNPKMGQPYVRGYKDGGVVSRLQVSGGASSIEDDPAAGVKVRGVGGGGRIGYRFDAGKDADLTVGVSGSASKVKVDTPEGSRTYKDKRITGADVSYRKGDTTYGASYDERPTDSGKVDRRVMLNFRKEF